MDHSDDLSIDIVVFVEDAGKMYLLNALHALSPKCKMLLDDCSASTCKLIVRDELFERVSLVRL